MQAITEVIFFSISILPVVLISIFIYKKDKDKEPINLLIKLFLAGIGSCFLVFLITFILESIFPFFGSDPTKLNLFDLFIFVFIGIALIEESCKWIMSYKFSYNDSEFDQFYDAILYSVYVALGFACFENLLYVYQGGIKVGILRAILAVPGHACDGMFMGYYLGLAKISSVNNRNDLKRKNIILSILIPTITHGIYDYCLYSRVPILMLFFLVFVISMYIYVIKKIKKVAKINSKIKYKTNYCPKCGFPVTSNYCPKCGNKNK